MKKLDYDFWKDVTTIASYLLFAVSFLGERFLPDLLVGIVSAFCVLFILYCGIKMFVIKRNG